MSGRPTSRCATERCCCMTWATACIKLSKYADVLVQRYYAAFGLRHELSVCRLWCCWNLRRNELFGNISARLVGKFMLKFWAKIRRGSRGSCNLSTRGYEQEVKVIWQKAPHRGPIPRLGVTPCHKWGGQICPDPTLWYFIFFRLPRISRKSSDTDTV